MGQESRPDRRQQLRLRNRAVKDKVESLAPTGWGGGRACKTESELIVLSLGSFAAPDLGVEVYWRLTDDLRWFDALRVRMVCPLTIPNPPPLENVIQGGSTIWYSDLFPLRANDLPNWLAPLEGGNRSWRTLASTWPAHDREVKSVGGCDWRFLFSCPYGYLTPMDCDWNPSPTGLVPVPLASSVLRQIRSAAGLPDPAEACRTIIRIVNETLGDV